MPEDRKDIIGGDVSVSLPICWTFYVRDTKIFMIVAFPRKAQAPSVSMAEGNSS